MNITIYRSASREEIQPTLLSFADGVVLERDFLDWSALKEQELIYSRYCYDTDTDNEQGVCIRDRMCILAADELQDVIGVTVNGKISPAMSAGIHSLSMEALRMPTAS